MYKSLHPNINYQHFYSIKFQSDRNDVKSYQKPSHRSVGIALTLLVGMT